MFKQLQRHWPALRQHATSWLRRYGWRLALLGILTVFLMHRDFEVQLSFNTVTAELAAHFGGVGESAVIRSKETPAAKPVSWKPSGNTSPAVQQKSYVNRFSAVAREEMNKFGIPASITLAQGLLESQAGASPLATKNNNHFGIKCFSRSCEKGHCNNFSDDHHKDFFRIYASAWESYRAHSLFLQKNRYKHLLKLPKDDYRSWAAGLQKAGYATDKRYAEKLISLIETLHLDRFDT